MGVVVNICPENVIFCSIKDIADRKLCPSGYVAHIRHRRNAGHIPGTKSAANKRVYTVISIYFLVTCVQYSFVSSMQWWNIGYCHNYWYKQRHRKLWSKWLYPIFSTIRGFKVLERAKFQPQHCQPIALEHRFPTFLFSDSVLFQHFNRWACTPKISYDKTFE